MQKGTQKLNLAVVHGTQRKSLGKSKMLSKPDVSLTLTKQFTERKEKRSCLI
ncbi:MAG: hypothetical protein P4L69_17360 [Desulfosporosinus sp.]|nr:hypothetical protein [Desulfosporosinus sp.]